MKMFIIVLLMLFPLAGCSTYHVRAKPFYKTNYMIFDQESFKADALHNDKHDYKVTKHYFLWGLVGDHKINVSRVCRGKNFRELVSDHDFVHYLGIIVTLGIWIPRSIEVWCEG